MDPPHINPTSILVEITTDSLKAVLWDALRAVQRIETNNDNDHTKPNPTPILVKITTDSLKAVLWDALRAVQRIETNNDHTKPACARENPESA